MAVTTLQLVLAVIAPMVVSSGDISCQGMRYTYISKGLDLKDIPRLPKQGIHLQICPRGVTCCTPDMETKLRTLSREQYSSSLVASTNHIQAIFHSKSRRFDEFFTELLSNSKRDFHFMFKKTYGILYERNSDVFTDFFKDLEAYYEHGNVDLESALRKFFEHLYERMFTVLNAQYTFDKRYLSCVSRNMKKLQPFGDVPKKLTLQLRRSFVATRTFAQALQEGKKVIAKILKIQPKEECVEALTKMTSCPACQGLPEIRPCSSYCTNVMKGCLAYHAEMSDSWDKYVEQLISVGERLIGPFNIEAVVEPIDIKISDAIMNFQESGYEVTQKVFQDCGQPRLGKRQTNEGGFGYKGVDSANRPLKPTTAAGTNLDTLVTEIIEKVKDTKGFWLRLPDILCKNPEVGSGRNDVEDNCWNGRDRGQYQTRVVNDGFQSQEQNPEVKVDTSRPDVYINEQIFALKLVTNKLENAYNGHSVDWPHYEPKYPNDSSYQGSGDCYDDEDCNDEGSGGSGEEPNDHEEGSGEDTTDNDDTENSNGDDSWPPWVVGSQADKDTNNGIEFVGSNENKQPYGDTNRTPPQTTGGSARLSGSTYRSLLYFGIPILVCFIGGLVN